MRKTTEELVNECVSELKDSQFDFNDLDAVDKQMLFQWFETFRRLAIENERECAEAVGVTASLPGTNNGYTFVAFNGSDVPYGTKLFTFPPAAQVPECSKCANRGKLNGLSQEFYCDSCKYSKTWLDDNFAAAPEGKQ